MPFCRGDSLNFKFGITLCEAGRGLYYLPTFFKFISSIFWIVLLYDNIVCLASICVSDERWSCAFEDLGQGIEFFCLSVGI